MGNYKRFYNIYIPIWFYFNKIYSIPSIYFYFIYIPIWFYFNYSKRLKFTEDKKIYIPIWFYFNEGIWATIRDFIIFTFQYGSTLIKYTLYPPFIFILFTFQYGSTLIVLDDYVFLSYYQFTFQYGSTLIQNIKCEDKLNQANLHSNMVLL